MADDIVDGSTPPAAIVARIPAAVLHQPPSERLPKRAAWFAPWKWSLSRWLIVAGIVLYLESPVAWTVLSDRGLTTPSGENIMRILLTPIILVLLVCPPLELLYNAQADALHKLLDAVFGG